MGSIMAERRVESSLPVWVEEMASIHESGRSIAYSKMYNFVVSFQIHYLFIIVISIVKI